MTVKKYVSVTSIQSVKVEATHVEMAYSPPDNYNSVKHYKKIMQHTIIEETQVDTSACMKNGSDSQSDITSKKKPNYSLMQKILLFFPVLGFLITVYSNYPEILGLLRKLKNSWLSFV